MSLRERRDILKLADDAAEGVLVTLVRAAGSTYRQPGARLLALPDGRIAGTISGGCLEADLLRKAQWRVREGAVTHRYDTGFDDDAEIPFGLGCGGVVDLLLEDRKAPETHAVLDAIAATLEGEARIVVTQLPEHPLGFGRIVIDPRGDVLFATESLETEHIVDLRAMALGRSTKLDPQHIFIEHLQPAQRLIVCGAGEDAKPVVRLAAQLGWTVIVVDGRSQHARAERFPKAQAVVVAHTLRALRPTPQDAVVVMTHSFEQDRGFMAELLALSAAQRPRYIGLLGARVRSALLLQHAAERAGTTLAQAVEGVHAPVGLELGGEGPESIALAIVAEVQHALSAAAPAAGVARRMSGKTAEGALASLGARAVATPVCALDLALEATQTTSQEISEGISQNAPEAAIVETNPQARASSGL